MKAKKKSKTKKKKKRKKKQGSTATEEAVVDVLSPQPAIQRETTATILKHQLPLAPTATEPASAQAAAPPPAAPERRRAQGKSGAASEGKSGAAAAAATEALRVAIADASLSKNELKKRIRRAEREGADPGVVEEANRAKSTRLSEAQRLKAAAAADEGDDDDAALWEAMAAESNSRQAAPPATAPSNLGTVATDAVPLASSAVVLTLLGVAAPRKQQEAERSGGEGQTKRIGRITVDLSRELYASANSTVYMGTIGSKAAVVKVTRAKGAESAGENREEEIMQDLAVSEIVAAGCGACQSRERQLWWQLVTTTTARRGVLAVHTRAYCCCL